MTKEYILKTGNEDNERLDSVNLAYDKYQDSLGNVLNEGMAFADFGCGNGNVSIFACSKVGEGGKVFAFDNDAEQLELVKDKIKKKNLKNIVCKNEDVYDLREYKEIFDIVYCRLLLVNLKKPLIGLKEILSTLKKGGIIIVEDVTELNGLCYPGREEYNDYMKYMNSLFIQNRLDTNIGLKLKSWFYNYGLSDINTEIFTPVLDTEKKKSLPYLNVLTTQNRSIMELNNLNMRKMITCLHEIMNDSKYFVTHFPTCIISGTKK
jgi:ubiquinone/menaquinone biosynthesis C-methylase UbiE